MRWDLPELTEDALVAYLKANVSIDMRVSAAWERDEMQYPAVIVHVDQTGPVSEPAAWHDPRELAVSVGVITEGAHELSSDGSIMRTARERNQQARSSVMSALFISDLNTQLINIGVEDIAFSMAQFSTTQRITEGRNLITTITGTIIAEPVTGS